MPDLAAGPTPAPTPWPRTAVVPPVLPEMTRPCAPPDLSDALCTPWSGRWVPAPVVALPAQRPGTALEPVAPV